MAESKTIAVLGAGGVGGLVGSLLARAGHRVIFLARSSTAERLRRSGVKVTSEQFGNFSVAVDAERSLTERVDLVLIAVKATQLHEALERLQPEHVAGIPVIPLLNGIEHVDTVRAAIPSATVTAGVIRVESTRTDVGEIEQKSSFVRIDIAGESASQDVGRNVASILDSAGIATSVQASEAGALWSKLAFLAPFALLTTRYDATIGEIRRNHGDELLAVLRETNEVASAANSPQDEDEQMRLYNAFPEAGTSSMNKDARAGLPLELDAIGGAVLRAADAAGIAVPRTRALVDDIASHQR